MTENAIKGLTIYRIRPVVQPLRFIGTATGKMQDLPDSPQALKSSLALAPFFYKKAILAVRKVPAQTLRQSVQSAFRMVQTP